MAAAALRQVGNRGIFLTVLRGLVHRSLRDPRSLKAQLLKSWWIELKRFSAPAVETVDLCDILGADLPLVQGGISSLALAALSTALGCRTIFEIGTYRGDTTWLLAHNDPFVRIFTLDLPDLVSAQTVKLELTDHEYFQRWERGRRFLGTAEASRITQLLGDSATFDFAPYEGRMDLVYIDASHSYSYVRSDSEAAMRMITPHGTIVWDDYTHYPGIYAYLNELDGWLDAPVRHIAGTRLAIYSRVRFGPPT